ncbi:MAG: retroviral-like aspartic protease family protein [Chloroflexi bacterium]|nr:retroviral-like aspartic protease family protein [Chloroflexota bacterium]
MGAFYQRIELAAEASGPSEEIEALVDTGATYTFVPGSVLRRLGIRPTGQREFEVADGRIKRYDIAVALVRLHGEVYPTLVVFGDEGTQPLLGVVTLETLGLGVDPVRQRLVPVRGLLL